MNIINYQVLLHIDIQIIKYEYYIKIIDNNIKT